MQSPGGQLALVSDLIPVYRTLYRWVESEHPRHPAGSSRGGEFTDTPGGQVPGGRKPLVASTRRREIAAMPDTIKQGHRLHISSLRPDKATKAMAWSRQLHDIMQQVEAAKSPEDEERAWEVVDKDSILSLLAEMNQMDRHHLTETGELLSDYVNANQMIPQSLAVRLDSGRRFFDPERIREKLKEHPPLNSEELESKWKLQHRQRGKVAVTDRERKLLSEFSKAERGLRNSLLKNPELVAAIEKTRGLLPAVPNSLHAEPSLNQKTGGSTVFDDLQARGSAKDNRQAEVVVKKPSRAFNLTPQLFGRMQKAISDYIGTDSHEHQAALENMVPQAFRALNAEAEEWNAGLREILGAHLGAKRIGAFVAKVHRAEDGAGVLHFDQLVDFAERHYPHIVASPDGPESGLKSAIEAGMKPTYKIDSPELIDKAVEMLGPEFKKSLDQLWSSSDSELQSVISDRYDPVPFSIRAMMRWMNLPDFPFGNLENRASSCHGHLKSNRRSAWRLQAQGA
ncbi:MAG: hypothetical protein KF752_11760 [Pirellulaceae bacterium]|nr:hypothetical protein [Pirellulaceae bacterium]